MSPDIWLFDSHGREEAGSALGQVIQQHLLARHSPMKQSSQNNRLTSRDHYGAPSWHRSSFTGVAMLIILA